MYCRSYNTLYGAEHTILRFGIPYGPRARPAAVVPAFVARAQRGEPLTIAGDGRQTRQFVYVEDLADGVVAALSPAAAGGVYNLVGDEEVSVRKIADIVRELVADVPIVHGPERPVDVQIGHVSGKRAAVELGWSAHTSFAEGVRRYVDWLTSRAARRSRPPPRAPPAAPRPSSARSRPSCRRRRRAGARRRPPRDLRSPARRSPEPSRARPSRAPSATRAAASSPPPHERERRRLKTPYGGR